MDSEKYIIINAIECGIIHSIVGNEHKHPLCGGGRRCKECTLGISVSIVNTDKCPLCGADRSGIKVTAPYNGAINIRYECGTISNICTHYTKRPNSITTIVIGDSCYGADDETDVI